MQVFDNYLQFGRTSTMIRLCVMLIFSGLFLSGCRYWVLYEFAEQFCEFEEYVSISWGDEQTKHVKIHFIEPVLERGILLRYLNAEPVESVFSQNIKTKKTHLSEDIFSIRKTQEEPKPSLESFSFKLRYHPLDEHALLESAYLDSRLSQLFSPALVEPILRSLCSDDYDLSFKLLDMRFTLSSLPKQSLPSLDQLISVFGHAEESISDGSDETSLRYVFDFLHKDQQGHEQAQNKPITMLFGFDSGKQLKRLYIQYHKYSYWLDVESLSGRLLVIRRE